MDSDESAFISEAESDGFVPEPVIVSLRVSRASDLPATTSPAYQLTMSSLNLSTPSDLQASFFSTIG